MLFSAAVAMLAGMGLDVLLARQWTANRRRASLIVAGGVASAAIILVVGRGHMHTPEGWVIGAWSALALVFLAALAIDIPTRRPTLFLVALTVAALVELYAAGRFLEYSHVSAPESLTALRPAVAFLQTQAKSPEAPRVLAVSDSTWDPGDLALIKSMFHGDPSGRIQDYVDAVKNKELLTPNLSGLFGIDSADGYDGGVLPVRRYVDLEGLLLPEDQLSPDGRLRDHLTSLPDARLLRILGADYVIADKNGDVWIDNVYFDLAFVTPITQSLTLSVTQPMIATALGLVSRIEGSGELPPDAVAGAIVGGIDVQGASGRPTTVNMVVGQTTDVEGGSSNLKTVSTPAAGQYFFATVPLPEAMAPTSITIRYDAPAGALAVRSLSLIDQRTGASLPVPVATDFRLVHDGDVKIYENKQAAPRAFMVHMAREEESTSTVEAMRKPDFNPANEVILGSAPPLLDQPMGVETVRIVENGTENVEIDVNATASGILVLADANYPGWEATVDGQPAPVLQANYYFRGVALNEGRHRVQFTFRPRSFNAGALISLLALGALVALLLPEQTVRTHRG